MKDCQIYSADEALHGGSEARKRGKEQAVEVHVPAGP